MIAKGSRILLKLSGEALGRGQGFCPDLLESICQQLVQLADYQWVIVPGGGNFFRGAHQEWCPRVVADQIGMLATAMNGLALQAALKRQGGRSSVLSCGPCQGVAEPYSAQKAWRALDQREVVICVGGIGSGFVTTDTATVVRACELECSSVLKASSVDGVYDQDPFKNPEAVFYPQIRYSEVLEKKLEVMDQVAFALAEENKKDLYVFSILQENALVRFFQGSLKHTKISLQ
jgi:uridylate kinase